MCFAVVGFGFDVYAVLIADDAYAHLTSGLFMLSNGSTVGTPSPSSPVMPLFLFWGKGPFNVNQHKICPLF